ncbi:MAG TPA: sigma 54-interacting transcriptional regulator [Candidatus Acidoferrales bacterium]|nr:sigma 54-interacting transcriptional regulator [Candidatus Acidoferrales bacterium]
MVQSHPTDALFGHAPAIHELRGQVRRLAAFDAPGKPVPTVLLFGETGTGKGLLARVIHDSGPRARNPFVDVNCAAIPEAMLEAELFGFEAGSFTDAKRAKPGLFEAASGGTLFLDEIDSLTAPIQGKVLKAIEDKMVRRLGAIEPRAVDVKLIAATQHDLKVLAAAGRFRADLYHRLAVLVLRLPALRERQDDAIALAEHFLAAHATAHGIAAKRLGESARAWLKSYAWPGNVRELAHLMERITLLSAADEVTLETLKAMGGTAPDSGLAESSLEITTPAERHDAEPTADSEEATRIRTALVHAGGNVVRAAQRLGIGRNALRYRMRRLGIGREGVDDDVAPASPAAAPPVPLLPATTPTWEQKAVAVLALALTFPEADDDPAFEPWTARLRWERVVSEHLAGFGGTVLSRGPSQVTAIFGVPRALEQTPLRAVQAALAMQRAASQATGLRLELRAAVHVGEVRFDAAAADPLSRLLPVAETFSLAERLLGHAGPGEVLLSPQAARRVGRACVLKPRVVQLGPAESDRVVVQLAGGPQLAPVGDTAPTEFVGRNTELDLLCTAFARAASGQGQTVFIAGDAGIGKTRLLAEFRQRLAGEEHRWIEGHCASYGTTTPFLPVIDSLRRTAGIDDQDDDFTATAKLKREVDQLGGDLTWSLPFIQRLLSLRVGDEGVHDLDSASRRSELFRALRALTLRAAELTPVVVVVEDLHWIDVASEEYLTFLTDVVSTARLLLVLTHRTGYSPAFAPHSAHTRLVLLPLDRRDVASMTSSILGALQVPEALRTLIAAKAEGNPFFVEELTKSLLEDGTLRCENQQAILTRPLESVSVPDTIQDVLSARLDRLAEESRRAIQVASVIGREFAMRLLARISEAGDHIQTRVEELRTLELIYEKALHPELAYMFKHALTHDVAYGSVVRDRRRALHRTIGCAIEELYADRLPEHYETLAHHFSCAEVWERALHYHELSAEKAAETHANRAVVEHCQRALGIAEKLAERVPAADRSRLNQLIGRACFYLSEYSTSATAYEEAAAHSSDPQARSLLLGAAAFSHFWAHNYEASQKCITSGLEVAKAHEVASGEAMAISVRGFYRGVHDGDLDDYERCSLQALAICERHPNEAVEGFAHMQLVLSAEWRGNYEETFARAATAITFGRRLRAPEIIIFPTWFLGKARCCTGDYGGALELLQEAYDLCDRIGDRAWKSRLLNTLGWCLAEIGVIESARSYNERAAVLAREIGDPEILANADINLAMNHLELGSLDDALRYLEPIEEMLAQAGDPWMRWRYALHVLHARAQIELARGNVSRVIALTDQELAGARRHHVPKVEARAFTLLARAQLAADNRDGVREALGNALSIAESIGYRRGMWEVHTLFAELARRGDDQRAVGHHIARARAALEPAVRSVTDPILRQALLARIAVS